jgi:hypothetical protein
MGPLIVLMRSKLVSWKLPQRRTQFWLRYQGQIGIEMLVLGNPGDGNLLAYNCIKLEWQWSSIPTCNSPDDLRVIGSIVVGIFSGAKTARSLGGSMPFLEQTPPGRRRNFMAIVSAPAITWSHGSW